METTLAVLGLIVVTAAVVLAAAAAWKQLRKEETIFDYQKGLLFHKGRFARLLDAGTYELSRKHDHVIKMDTRPVLFTVPGQEILTRDRISVKVTVGGTYAIADPHTAFSGAMSYNATLYADAQGAWRAGRPVA